MDTKREEENLHSFFVEVKGMSEESFTVAMRKLAEHPAVFDEFKHTVFGYQSDRQPVTVNGKTASSVRKSLRCSILDSYLYLADLLDSDSNQ